MSLNFPLNPTEGEIYPNPKLSNLPQFQWRNASKTWLKILEGGQATETVAGIAEIATQAEVNTGTDNSRIVTPAKLKQWSLTNISGPNSNSNLVIFSETAPSLRPDNSTLVAGDFWYDTATSMFFVYVVDADSAQWVQLNSPTVSGGGVHSLLSLIYATMSDNPYNTIYSGVY